MACMAGHGTFFMLRDGARHDVKTREVTAAATGEELDDLSTELL